MLKEIEAKKFPVKYLQAVFYFEKRASPQVKDKLQQIEEETTNYQEGLKILYPLLQQVE